jgi:hypothetical protein
VTTEFESPQSRLRRARSTPEAIQFVTDGGWSAVSPRSGDRGGLVAHRGVLHPSEWIDREAVLAVVERHLGFSKTQAHSVYRGGPMSDAQHRLRRRIDARLLAVAEAGGNMVLLASVLGFYVGTNRSCKVMATALKRAREEI